MNKSSLALSFFVSLLLAGCFGTSASKKTERCPAYLPSVAFLMAQVSAASYESDRDQLADALYGLGLTLDSISIKDSNTGTQGLLAYNNDIVVLAFRGTEDFKDWLGNAKAWENKINSGPNCDQTVKVHQGFKDAIRSVTKDGKLLSRIAELQQSGRKFYLSGHSLGGALATLMAYLSTETINIDGIYTFGQPPVGNAGFRQCYDAQLLEKTFRFVNYKDVVPRVNPNNNLKHVGLLLFLNKDGDLATEEPKGLLNTAKNVLDTALVESHSIGAYANDLDQHKNTNPFTCE